MSKTIKFTVSDENYEKLMQKAGDASIQDYIRSVLFPDQTPLVTPEDAVKKALEKYQKGDGFTVSEIFGDDWNLPNGYAGVFGRRFNKLIKEKYSDKIRYTGYYTQNGNAIYEMI